MPKGLTFHALDLSMFAHLCSDPSAIGVEVLSVCCIMNCVLIMAHTIYKWLSSPIFLCCLVDTSQHPTPSDYLQVFSVEQEDYSTLINSIYGCIRAFIGDIDATALKKADWLFGPIFFILFIFIMFFVMLTVLIAVSLPSHQVAVPRVFLALRWVHSNSI